MTEVTQEQPIESEVVDVESLEWKRVRPEVTREVYARTLLSGPVTVVLTRVLPGGGFATHRDPYAHVFYFLGGLGAVDVAGARYEARPGTVVRIAPGVPHAYENTGDQDLVLISANVPVLERN